MNSLNWVQKRKSAEDHLRLGIGNVFDELRTAIQAACASFNDLYDGNASPDPINGHQIRITINPRTTSEASITVNLREQDRAVDVTYTNTRKDVQHYRISADDDGAFLATTKGERISVDEASKLILEHVFFPAAPSSNKSVYQRGRLI